MKIAKNLFFVPIISGQFIEEDSTTPAPPEQHVDVPCESNGFGHIISSYTGTIGVTKSGRECQNWVFQSPHEHDHIPEEYDGLGQHNFCRNPDDERPEGAWCYTMDENVRWEYCQCNDEGPSGSCQASTVSVFGSTSWERSDSSVEPVVSNDRYMMESATSTTYDQCSIDCAFDAGCNNFLFTSDSKCLIFFGYHTVQFVPANSNSLITGYSGSVSADCGGAPWEEFFFTRAEFYCKFQTSYDADALIQEILLANGGPNSALNLQSSTPLDEWVIIESAPDGMTESSFVSIEAAPANLFPTISTDGAWIWVQFEVILFQRFERTFARRRRDVDSNNRIISLAELIQTSLELPPDVILLETTDIVLAVTVLGADGAIAGECNDHSCSCNYGFDNIGNTCVPRSDYDNQIPQTSNQAQQESYQSGQQSNQTPQQSNQPQQGAQQSNQLPQESDQVEQHANQIPQQNNQTPQQSNQSEQTPQQSNQVAQQSNQVSQQSDQTAQQSNQQPQQSNQ